MCWPGSNKSIASMTFSMGSGGISQRPSMSTSFFMEPADRIVARPGKECCPLPVQYREKCPLVLEPGVLQNPADKT